MREGTTTEEIIPAFIIIVMMPLTGSIALGLALGFVSYEFGMILARRTEEMNLSPHFITVVSLLYIMTL